MLVTPLSEDEFEAMIAGKELDRFETFVLRREFNLPAERPEHFPREGSDLAKQVVARLLERTLAKIGRVKKES